jgi:hypothetical protein
MTAEYSETPNDPSSIHSRITPRELNELHRQFWARQSKLTDKRISDPFLYASATASMHSEAIREVPLKNRKTLELALAEAESEKVRFQNKGHFREGWSTEQGSLQEFSRKGGRARKGDLLSKLIEALVRANPTMNERTLFLCLKRQIGEGVILSIDTDSSVVAGNVRVITFEDKDGRRKTASVSGLKDRLARTKAKINSR